MANQSNGQRSANYYWLLDPPLSGHFPRLVLKFGLLAVGAHLREETATRAALLGSQENGRDALRALHSSETTEARAPPELDEYGTPCASMPLNGGL